MFRKRLLLVVASCLLIVTGLHAMPPRPGTIEPAEVARLKARLGIDCIKDPVRDRGKKGMFNSTKTGFQVLVSGTKRMPCVLMDYTDFSHEFAQAAFDSMLFDTTEGWPIGSAHDYYTACSYGWLDLRGNAYGWFPTDTTRDYYAGGSYGFGGSFPRNAGGLVWLAASLSDSSVDYSQFDNDGDGYVDCLWVVHAWYGAEESQNGNDIWSHSSDIRGWTGGQPYVTNDPWPGHPGEFVKIGDYIIMPERSNYSSLLHDGMVSIGVFCHEFGHSLGLPDLYDVSYGGEGLGTWCLMAGGSWGGNSSTPRLPVHMCSWAKADLGWITPTVVPADGYRDVSLMELIPQCYKLWTAGNPTSEYFLIENRQQIQYDQMLPYPGLLIYHIDENVINTYRPSNTVNVREHGVYGVAIEEADGDRSLFYGANGGDRGDPFPGRTNNTSFDSLGTNPDSRSNSEENTHCGVTSIPPSFGLMSPYFYVGPQVGMETPPEDYQPSVAVPALQAVPNPFRRKTNLRLSGWGTGASVAVTVYNVLGRKVCELVVQPGSPRESSISWDGKDSQGRLLGPGVYVLRAQSTWDSATRRVVLLP